jgi:hypothetical protein
MKGSHAGVGLGQAQARLTHVSLIDVQQQVEVIHAPGRFVFQSDYVVQGTEPAYAMPWVLLICGLVMSSSRPTLGNQAVGECMESG